MIYQVLLALTFGGSFGADNSNPLSKDASTVQMRLGDASNEYLEHVPHQLSFEVFEEAKSHYRHHCDASIIAQKWALTAAACTYHQSPDKVQLRSGSQALGVGGKVHRAVQIITHEKYKPAHREFNVGLVKVHEPFLRGRAIKLAPGYPAPGSRGVASGWGVLPGTSITPPVLRLTQLEVFDLQVCKLYFNNNVTLHDSVLCASSLYVKPGDCGGDYGGPFTVGDYQAGIITSYTCDRDSIGIFANVAFFRGWISTQVRAQKRLRSGWEDFESVDDDDEDEGE